MQTRLLNKITKDLKKISMLELSRRMKIPCSTLWRIANKTSSGRMASWDIIEKYYKKYKRKQ
jgi:predicted transcriptional regulator